MKALVSWFLDSRVAANLLAFLLVVVGVFAATTLVVRLFPEINPYSVSITVPYPGASPSEVEESIVEPIEEQLEGLEDVRKITSLAAENVASIIVALEDGADTQDKVNEVRTQISQITTFPADAEEPQVTELEVDELIAQVVLHGQADPVALKRAAQGIRTRLTQAEGVSQARIAGVADYLIDISVSEAELRALGLSLPALARTISAESLELSGGEVESEGRRTRLRTVGKRETGEGFEDLVVATSAEGTPVTLGDIAEVTDGLSETPVLARFNGAPAVVISVFRSGDESVFRIVEAVRAELDASADALPPGVEATLWRDESGNLDSRIDLLTRNALIGLALVLVILLLFLDIRVAFWVAVGVAISFVGAFIPMALWGVSINQLSLFGFILAIGIVVDDAIVVGENIYATAEEAEEVEGGVEGVEIARDGTHRVVSPVVFSVSTTVAAFLPLIFLPGQFGQFLGTIAYVVIFVLVLSLIESFFILPKHLSHMSTGAPRRLSPRRLTDPLRNKVAARLDRFSERRLRPAIEFAVIHPAVVVLGMIGVLAASIGLLTSGVVKGTFFPEVEGNYVTASLQLAEAASEDQTVRAVERILDGLEGASAAVAEEAGVEAAVVTSDVFWSLGVDAGGGNNEAPGVSGGAAANRAYVTVLLQDAAERRFGATEFEDAWREAVGAVPGAQTLAFSSNLVSSGAPIQIEVRGTDEAAAREVTALMREELTKVQGVFDVRDDRFATTDEVQIELLPQAAAYGLSLQDVASQVRAAFFGAEAVRIQRDREEIEVRVRYTEGERSSLASLRNARLYVAPRPGQEAAYVPLSQVARLTVGDAPSAITRQDGRRTFVISADQDGSVISAGEAVGRITGAAWARIAQDYPGVAVVPGGDAEEQARVAPVLQRNYILALFAIYALLSLAFRSYTKPLIVMSIIPFGLVGALIGHALFGYKLSLLSMFGVIGLSGVIINDALLMVDYINEGLGRGKPVRLAIADAAVSRFRPILLTTLTTFLGIAPLILERSVQAAFLVPTAISLGFGILFGTVILMLLVPAVAMLHAKTRSALTVDGLKRGWAATKKAWDWADRKLGRKAA